LGRAIELPDVLEFAAPVPNPAGEEVRLAYGIPRDLDGGTLQLKVYDLSGREVRTHDKGKCQPGAARLTWDLRSNAAARVGAGVYFLKLRAGEQEIKRSVLILR
jgi:flagellar hook assembly protein FlgD